MIKDKTIIDGAIISFIEGKNIHVDRDPKSDWFIIEFWRQLTWNVDDVEYLIEIFPKLDENGEAISWILYCAAYYDTEDKRFYIKKEIANEKSLSFISENIDTLLEDSFRYISNIPKEQIPFGVNLSV